MLTVDFESLKKYEEILSNTEGYMADRVDSLFCIKAFEEVEAVDVMIRAFRKEERSQLLRHEMCYVLGQMNKTPEHVLKIQAFLEEIIDEKGQYEDIVVHEAVEALGNLSQEQTLKLIERFNDPSKTCEMVYETCFLANELIKWNKETDTGAKERVDFKKLQFKTNDPAPPFNVYDEPNPQHLDVAYLGQLLINKVPDQSFNLFERYRALFTLRELNSKESIIAICQTLTEENMDTCGALLKHEVAYVVAQMEDQNQHAVDYLLGSVLNDEEAPIVRHEALIAVGEMINDKEKLAHLLTHSDDIVRESAEVATRNIENRQAWN